VNSDQEFESLLKEHGIQLDEEERQKKERRKERAAAKKAKEAAKHKVKRRKEDGEGGEDGGEPQVKVHLSYKFIFKNFLARTSGLLRSMSTRR
jgi:hypothetical protein